MRRSSALESAAKEGGGATCGGSAPTVRPGDGGGATPSAEANAYKTPGGSAIPQCVQWWCISVSRSWQLGQWIWIAIHTSQTDMLYMTVAQYATSTQHRNA